MACVHYRQTSLSRYRKHLLTAPSTECCSSRLYCCSSSHLSSTPVQKLCARDSEKSTDDIESFFQTGLTCQTGLKTVEAKNKEAAQ